MLWTNPLRHVNGGSPIKWHCAYCQEPGAMWKGTDKLYYCNEWCEEGGPNATKSRPDKL